MHYLFHYWVTFGDNSTAWVRYSDPGFKTYLNLQRRVNILLLSLKIKLTSVGCVKLAVIINYACECCKYSNYSVQSCPEIVSQVFPNSDVT